METVRIVVVFRRVKHIQVAIVFVFDEKTTNVFDNRLVEFHISTSELVHTCRINYSYIDTQLRSSKSGVRLRAGVEAGH